jgi:hypothetical protein
VDLGFPQLVDDLFRSEVLSAHLFPLFCPSRLTL